MIVCQLANRAHYYLKLVALITTATLTALPMQPSWGQETTDNDDTLRWWQVEVIVFTWADYTTSGETWPTDIELNFPNEWQTLIPLESELSEEETDLSNESTENTQQNPTIAEDVTEDAIEEDSTEEELNPDEIRLLPETEFQLMAERNRITRNNNHRLLWHGAWRQHMEKFRNEEPIIFTAGEQYDDHFELEGSLHIYWQRLLHFDINLWFSEFTINAGQERLPWPDLPTRPNSYVPNFQFGSLDTTLQNLDQPDQTSERTTVFTDGTDLASQRINNTLNSDLTSVGTINTRDWFDQRGNTTFYDSRYDEILARNYVVDHVVLNKQDRPMRSEELHYIDHPKFGVLVKITHYIPPEPEPTEEEILLDELIGLEPQQQ